MARPKALELLFPTKRGRGWEGTSTAKTRTCCQPSDGATCCRNGPALTNRKRPLDDAILIGLVGGTGVGKSTFINALAGQGISRSSDRRPTTNRVVVYRNMASELPPDVPTQYFAQPQVLHEKDNLTKVILFDFPDFDSAETSHAKIVAEYLPHLDVVFIVVDDVKYGDRRLYDLLSRLAHDKGNMFVLLNKVDRLVERYGEQAPRVIEEIHTDLREKLAEHAKLELDADQLFAISAKSVFDVREKGLTNDDTRAFGKVERVLERYQKEKHRRAAKERNLDARKAALLERVRKQALGPDNRAIIDESQQLVAKWRAESEQASAAIPVEILTERERRGLRSRRMRRVSSSWGFPVSLLITLISEVRRLRKADVGAQPANISARIHHHYRAFFESLANLRARIESEVAGTALAGATRRRAQSSELSTSASASPLPAPESADALTIRLGRELEGRIAAGDQKPKRIKRLVCHLPALLVVGLAAWSKIYPLLDSIDGSTERGFFATLFSTLWQTLSPSFLFGIVFSILLAYFLSAVFVWIREIQILEGEIADGEQYVRQEIRKYGDSVIGAIDGRVQSLHQEFEQLSEAIQ